MAERWRGRGWARKPSPSRTTHTVSAAAGGAGVDVRGFNSRPDPTTARRGDKTRSTPSRRAVAQPHQQIAAVRRRHRMDRQARLSEALNPVIRGGRHDCSTVCRRETGADVDAERRHHLRVWRRCRQPHQSRQGAAQTSGRQTGGRRHVTPPGAGTHLACHAARPIRRHVKVQARRSPDDGEEGAWSTRRGHAPGVSTRVSTVLKRPAGKGRPCGDDGTLGDGLDGDHSIPRAAGGREAYPNWQRLPRYGHVEKTARARRRCA